MKKGEVVYGKSDWTAENTGRYRFCLGSGSSGVACTKPELRQPAAGGSSPVRLHGPNGSDGRRHHRKNAGAQPLAERAVAAVFGRAHLRDQKPRGKGRTSSGREHHDSAITTANYEFKLAGEQEIGPYHCLVLEATPKRKDKYLFEGKIWVDAEDFAVVKIGGHPAKKPSFWINRADFVRQYQKVDGFWVPYRDETSVEVKMYGRRVFTIDHQQYVINLATPLQAETGGDPEDQLR